MTTNADTYRYELTTDVNAPVSTVWRAWTDAAEYEAWSRSVPGSVEIDPKSGGSWKATVATPDGQEFPVQGTYLTVDENKHIDMSMDVPGDEPDQVMSLHLTDLGSGRTRIEISQDCPTEEARDISKEGSSMLLEWCVAHVTAA